MYQLFGFEIWLITWFDWMFVMIHFHPIAFDFIFVSQTMGYLHVWCLFVFVVEILWPQILFINLFFQRHTYFTNSPEYHVHIECLHVWKICFNTGFMIFHVLNHFEESIFVDEIHDCWWSFLWKLESFNCGISVDEIIFCPHSFLALSFPTN